MMRKALTALSLSIATIATVPVIAQMPAELPGKADPARVVAGNYKVDTGHTLVVFKVDHLGFNSYWGIFGGSTGTLTIDPAKPAAATVSIEIPLSGITTTSEGLTTHMKGADFFEIAKFPTATFKSTSVAVSGTTAKISGNLTVKGITKPIVLDAKFTGAGPHPMNKKVNIGFEATGTLKRSDFGIAYGIPMVSDQVELKITAAFEKAD
jgi:polyisoprenoid-binding protein YceI